MINLSGNRYMKIISCVTAMAFFWSIICQDISYALQPEIRIIREDFKTAFQIKYAIEQAKDIIDLIEQRSAAAPATIEDIRLWQKSTDSEFNGAVFEARDDEISIKLSQGNVIIRYFDPTKSLAIPQGTVSASYWQMDGQLSRNLSRQLLYTDKLQESVLGKVKVLSEMEIRGQLKAEGAMREGPAASTVEADDMQATQPADLQQLLKARVQKNRQVERLYELLSRTETEIAEAPSDQTPENLARLSQIRDLQKSRLQRINVLESEISELDSQLENVNVQMTARQSRFMRLARAVPFKSMQRALLQAAFILGISTDVSMLPAMQPVPAAAAKQTPEERYYGILTTLEEDGINSLLTHAKYAENPSVRTGFIRGIAWDVTLMPDSWAEIVSENGKILSKEIFLDLLEGIKTLGDIDGDLINIGYTQEEVLGIKVAIIRDSVTKPGKSDWTRFLNPDCSIKEGMRDKFLTVFKIQNNIAKQRIPALTGEGATISGIRMGIAMYLEKMSIVDAAIAVASDDWTYYLNLDGTLKGNNEAEKEAKRNDVNGIVTLILDKAALTDAQVAVMAGIADFGGLTQGDRTKIVLGLYPELKEWIKFSSQRKPAAQQAPKPAKRAEAPKQAPQTEKQTEKSEETPKVAEEEQKIPEEDTEEAAPGIWAGIFDMALIVFSIVTAAALAAYYFVIRKGIADRRSTGHRQINTRHFQAALNPQSENYDARRYVLVDGAGQEHFYNKSESGLNDMLAYLRSQAVNRLNAQKNISVDIPGVGTRTFEVDDRLITLSQEHGININALIMDSISLSSKVRAAPAGVNPFEGIEDRPISIVMLDRSRSLFEDHIQNHFIGINTAVFDVIAKSLPEDARTQGLEVILATGITHELRHEAGVGSTGSDETALSAEDTKVTVSMALERGISLTRISSSLAGISSGQYVTKLTKPSKETRRHLFAAYIERGESLTAVSAGELITRTFGDQAAVRVETLRSDLKSLLGDNIKSLKLRGQNYYYSATSPKPTLTEKMAALSGWSQARVADRLIRSDLEAMVKSLAARVDELERRLGDKSPPALPAVSDTDMTAGAEALSYSIIATPFGLSVSESLPEPTQTTIEATRKESTEEEAEAKPLSATDTESNLSLAETDTEIEQEQSTTTAGPLEEMPSLYLEAPAEEPAPSAADIAERRKQIGLDMVQAIQQARDTIAGLQEVDTEKQKTLVGGLNGIVEDIRLGRTQYTAQTLPNAVVKVINDAGLKKEADKNLIAPLVELDARLRGLKAEERVLAATTPAEERLPRPLSTVEYTAQDAQRKQQIKREVIDLMQGAYRGISAIAETPDAEEGLLFEISMILGGFDKLLADARRGAHNPITLTTDYYRTVCRLQIDNPLLHEIVFGLYDRLRPLADEFIELSLKEKSAAKSPATAAGDSAAISLNEKIGRLQKVLEQLNAASQLREVLERLEGKGRLRAADGIRALEKKVREGTDLFSRLVRGVMENTGADILKALSDARNSTEREIQRLREMAASRTAAQAPASFQQYVKEGQYKNDDSYVVKAVVDGQETTMTYDRTAPDSITNLVESVTNNRGRAPIFNIGDNVTVYADLELARLCQERGINLAYLVKYAIEKRGINKFAPLLKKTEKTEISIVLLDGSRALFEDHAEDNFIGINRILFDIENDDILNIIITAGVSHELRHEAGIGNSTTEETMLTDEDTDMTTELALSEDVDLKDLLRAVAQIGSMEESESEYYSDLSNKIFLLSQTGEMDKAKEPADEDEALLTSILSQLDMSMADVSPDTAAASGLEGPPAGIFDKIITFVGSPSFFAVSMPFFLASALFMFMAPSTSIAGLLALSGITSAASLLIMISQYRKGYQVDNEEIKGRRVFAIAAISSTIALVIGSLLSRTSQEEIEVAELDDEAREAPVEEPAAPKAEEEKFKEKPAPAEPKKAPEAAKPQPEVAKPARVAPDVKEAVEPLTPLSDVQKRLLLAERGARPNRIVHREMRRDQMKDYKAELDLVRTICKSMGFEGMPKEGWLATNPVPRTAIEKLIFDGRLFTIEDWWHFFDDIMREKGLDTFGKRRAFLEMMNESYRTARKVYTEYLLAQEAAVKSKKPGLPMDPYPTMWGARRLWRGQCRP